MTDLDRRVQALETRMTIAEEQRRQILEGQVRMEAKLDELRTAAAMGKGAWFVIMKVGAVLVALGYVLMWAADHFGWWKH